MVAYKFGPIVFLYPRINNYKSLQSLPFSPPPPTNRSENVNFLTCLSDSGEPYLKLSSFIAWQLVYFDKFDMKTLKLNTNSVFSQCFFTPLLKKIHKQIIKHIIVYLNE